MPVNLKLPGALPVAGVELATVACGLKKNGSPDLVLVRLAAASSAAGVFTTNAFRAAPVIVAEEHLAASAGDVRALLVNAGNANAGTGADGLALARAHCEAVAAALDVSANVVLPFSTGVIGQLLPDIPMREGIADAVKRLDAAASGDAAGIAGAAPAAGDGLSAWQAAARGIMTTDTAPKLTSRTVEIGGSLVTLTGFAKGAGMIQPNMATMLAYVFTDAAISAVDLSFALRAVLDDSFNAITVDSDTSTNDALMLCATGLGPALSRDGDERSGGARHGDLHVAHGHEAGAREGAWDRFVVALRALCLDLAQAIVRDAEGATKFISVRVTGGDSRAECRAVGYAIANSPLVKTAMFASDANVGRLLMAIGKAELPGLSPAGIAAGLTGRLDADAVLVSVGDVRAFERGGMAVGYTEERGAVVLAEDEIVVTVELGRGDAEASIYTSDLSHDYVSINADYRS